MEKINEKGKSSLKSRKKILSLVYTAFFTALIVVCSYISFYIGPVPVTMQLLAIYLASGLLGWKNGTLSYIIYLLLGVMGLPVFAGGQAGGIARLASATGGYIIGFIFTSLIVGLTVKLFGRKIHVLIIGMIIGLSVCYAFGTAWFMILYNSSSAQSIGLGAALMTCVVPYLPCDAAKIAIAAVLINKLNKYIRI